MQWHLYQLDYKEGVYQPSFIESFDDIDSAINRQKILQGKGIQTQVSNVLNDNPHRIFDL